MNFFNKSRKTGMTFMNDRMNAMETGDKWRAMTSNALAQVARSSSDIDYFRDESLNRVGDTR